ncbi:hypothetical protein A11A3_00410 [Alcanivorax hongdengensis A-11-3]|uniref:PilZ domain-containing protein n=1 Tax=Alcanivorax hongdengensis A-11-3 TaxID=1177179 RepID=L0WJB8_9GAMM|nr:PilZ domain-containing protein [Alcanivorax hongdengensis]EKF75910.1 hypothetical protein A11A3_00410 [Alcanivorax hongdengensis A-11-3]
MKERRRAHRIAFDGAATLIFGQDRYPVSLEDLSVQGARVSLSEPLALPDASPVTLHIVLDDSDIQLLLPALIKRQMGSDVGLMFKRAAVEDMQHLRRLVMLHQGDEAEDDPATLLPPEA